MIFFRGLAEYSARIGQAYESDVAVRYINICELNRLWEKPKLNAKNSDENFSPHGHALAKGAAVGAAAGLGGIKGAGIGWVGGPGSFGTGTLAGAAMGGGAVALGAKSVTKCPECGKHQLF